MSSFSTRNPGTFLLEILRYSVSVFSFSAIRFASVSWRLRVFSSVISLEFTMTLEIFPFL